MADQALDRREALAGGGAAFALGALPGLRASAHDRFGRVTLDATLNGRGPFRLALDSAASLSLIVSDLVEPLGLAPAGDVAMHTLLGREVTPTVRVGDVSSGAMRAQDVRMAVGSRAAMGGLDGLISPVLLADHRVTLNFRGDSAVIGRGRTRDQSMFSPERRVRFWSPPNDAFRDLVMLRASIDGRPVTAVVDTGSASTLANTALARSVRAVSLTLQDGGTTRDVLSATGRAAEARAMLVNGLHLGPLSMERLPLLVGDFHAFDVWGLADRPALLLGVDVLGSLRRMVIDYQRRDVVFDV